MENHKRSKKHAENVSKLLQELGDDDEEHKKDDDVDDDVDDDEEKLSAADADDVEVDDDLPDMSQSRYYTHCSHVYLF